MVPDLALRRTLKMRTSTGVDLGASFTINQRDQQWLVTAQHVVDAVADPYNDLRVVSQTGDEMGELDQVPLVSPGADVAVFSLTGRVLTADFALRPLEDNAHFFLSQEVYFLGFPFGLSIRGIGETYPLVKHAIISSFDMGGAIDVVLLDGINNPGFSGGPIVFKRLDTREDDWRVLGVIHGYHYEDVPVDGGQGTVKMNTGIIIGYGIRHAIEAIDAAII